MVKHFAVGDIQGNTDVTADMLPDLLGVRKCNFGIAEEENQGWASYRLGVDLCWGRITHHRNGSHRGQRATVKTGSLGDVMQESIQAAITVVRL